MIDPLVLKNIALGFTALFTAVAWHKLSDFNRFEQVLRDYRLFPAPVNRPLAVIVPAIELTLALGWVSGQLLHITAATSAALLASYAMAMAVNLARGRIYIDCGCGFGAVGAEEQPLSWSLVARNSFLIGLAILPLVPATGRDLGVADYVVVFASLVTAILLYAGSGQLIKNWTAIMTWRKA